MPAKIQRDLQKLSQFINEIKNTKTKAYAVYVQLSALDLSKMPPDYMLRIYGNFNSLINKYQTQIFMANGSDLLFFFHNLPRVTFEEHIEKIKRAIKIEIEISNKNPVKIIYTYDLELDYIQLEALVNKLMLLPSLKDKGNSLWYKAVQLFRRSEKSLAGEMSIRDAVKIEEKLQKTPPENLLAWQNVYALVEDKTPVRIFREYYIYSYYLEKGEKAQITSNPWLFLQLTRAMDEIMLNYAVSATEEFNLSGFSLNLNLSTIKGKAFKAFDEKMPAKIKQNIVIEFNILDIIANPALYPKVNQELKAKNYKTCVDGVSYNLFAHFNGESFNTNFIKLKWHDELAGNITNQESETIRALATKRSAFLILCRCNNQQALDWGRKHQIKLFQGDIVDIKSEGEEMDLGVLFKL